jgi:DeoR/GlpR family transcriptional regulator of sugar metabolism
MTIAANRSLTLPAVRRRRALILLRSAGAVTCQDLQREFHISAATARRDIAAVVRRGHGVRVYGGAVREAATYADLKVTSGRLPQHVDSSSL